MKKQNLLAGTALATVMAMTAMPSLATELNLGPAGAFSIKFDNFESFNGTGGLQTGNSNFGIISVTSISNNNSINVWNQGATGTPGTNGFIFGIFDDIHVDSVTGGPVDAHGAASGGHIDLYYFSSLPGTFNVNQGTGGYAAAGGSCTINQLCYHGISDAGGELILQLDLTPGIDPTSTTTTLVSTSTLSTTPFTGQSSAYLNVVGGTDAGQFDSNGFAVNPGGSNPGFADMFLQEDFCVAGSATACTKHGDWALDSHDPVDANVVPEPASLAIIGSAMLGFGVFGRRRRRK